MRNYLALFVTLCTSMSAVARGQSSPTTQPGSTEDPRRVAYFHHTLVDAYDSIGSRNPAWDADARKVLELTVQRWMLPEFDPDIDWQVVVIGRRAIDHGCNDPAVLYSTLRAHLNLDISLKGEVLGRLDAAVSNCKYAPYVKVFALARLLDHAKQPARQKQLLESIYETLPSLLAEKDFPQEYTVQLCSDLTSFGAAHDGNRMPMMEKLEGIIAKALPDSGMAYLFLGSACWKYSWDAPGVGLPEKFGSSRAQRHQIGKQALESALRENPHLAAASEKMVGTLVDMGIIGAEPERYFQRAIADNPDCLPAYRYKIGALNTGAPGADTDVLNFGRACLATRRWRSRIPFLLLRAHRTVAGSDAIPARSQNESIMRKSRWRPSIWKSPGSNSTI